MEKVKKIDIHAHVCVFPEFFPREIQNLITVDELIKTYDDIGVEKGVLLPLTSGEGMVSPIPTESVRYIYEQYKDRFFWFCNVDPRALINTPNSDLARLIGEYKKMGAKGVGEITAQLYADDPKMDNLFRACAENDMPTIIHISPNFGGGYGIVDELGLPRITSILKKYPDLKIIGHSMAFWSEISADNNEKIRNEYPKGKVTEGRLAQMLRECPNLYCDLSATSGSNAIMRDREYSAKFFEEFSDRIMFGIDQCLPHQNFTYTFSDFMDEMVKDGLLSEENYRKIMRENAIRILKL